MVKNTVVALVAAATMAGIAVPVFAAPLPPEPATEVTGRFDNAFGGGSVEMRAFTADSVLAQLRQNGINASAVEDWGGLIRAYVTLTDGSEAMQFFRPGSLERVLL